MKIYNCDISKISDLTYDEWLNNVGQAKKEYALRFKKEADRKRTIAGEILAREGISKELNISADEIEFTENGKGKPIAKNLNIFFNISHSFDYVVCAIRKADDLGVDIEKIRPFNPIILKRVCNEAEADYIYGGHPKKIDFSIMRRFFEVWTAKEAIVKLYGDGLGIGLSNINVVENGKIATDDIILEQVEINPDYICTVAYR